MKTDSHVISTSIPLGEKTTVHLPNMISQITKFLGLIVDDDYLGAVSGQIRQMCKEISCAYDKYLEILQKVRDEAIPKGNTHDAIAAFLEMGEVINGKIEDAGGCSDVTLDCFLGEIDDADEYIY